MSAETRPLTFCWREPVRTMLLIALASFASGMMPRATGATTRSIAPPVPAPQTVLGREVEMLLLSLRSAVVLVPVGIVVAAVRRTRQERRALASRPIGACAGCGLTEHSPDAAYCRRCGDRLMPATGTPR